MLTSRYGEHPSQVGDLHLPADGVGDVPVAALLHGGYWRERYARDLNDALARDLEARGWAAWNLEYRRMGGDGGWDETSADVAAGIDHLAELAVEHPIDLACVIAIGHSAGGQLALWAAGRPAPRVRLAGAVSQAGVADLVDADLRGLSDGAAALFLGGSAAEMPGRYAEASPLARVPLGIAQLVVHGDRDEAVPVELSRAYVAAARAAGDAVEYAELAGCGHMQHLDPASAAWATVIAWLPPTR